MEQTRLRLAAQRRELELLTGTRDEQTARAQLLAYQVEELDDLDLQDGELAALEQEQKQLANAEEILQERPPGAGAVRGTGKRHPPGPATAQ